MRPRVREGSLAHTYSRDGKHHDPAADSQLADLDRLVEKGHLCIYRSLADPNPGHDRAVDDCHNAVVAVADGVGRPDELYRPVHSDHMYPRANDCPLSRVHRHGVGRLDD